MLFCFSADIISCVEFNNNGELLATGDKGGRVVIFQRDGKVEDHYDVPTVRHFYTFTFFFILKFTGIILTFSKSCHIDGLETCIPILHTKLALL